MSEEPREERREDPAAREARAQLDLSVWLDGECDARQRARVERALREEPDLALKLAAWRRHDSALRAAFAQDISAQDIFAQEISARQISADRAAGTLEPLRFDQPLADPMSDPLLNPLAHSFAPAPLTVLLVALVSFATGAALGALALVAYFLPGP